MSRLLRLTFVLAFGALLSAPALAQSRQLVINQMDFAASVFADDSYSISRNASGMETMVGLLGGGTRAYLELELEAGREYIVSAACDEDCSDLDLVLRTEGGEVVAQDVETDDVPIISLTPTSSGRYLLGVSMIDCETDLCYFGYRIYERTIDI